MSNTADYQERHPYDWPFDEPAPGLKGPRRRVSSIMVLPANEWQDGTRTTWDWVLARAADLR